MLFNSLNYLLFFPIVVALYFFLPPRAKRGFLLAASLFFYSCWNVKYTLLMVLSIVITFVTGIGVEDAKEERRKKAYVFFCFLINLGILFLFKYANFTVNTYNRLAGLFNGTTLDLSFRFLLPVGISFYTFQALGYTVDVYRSDLKAERNLLDYALFVSFFPQLVAGPIERSTNLLPQIKKPATFSYENMVHGFVYMCWGFFLKLVLADRVAILVNEVFNDSGSYGGLMLLVGAVFFTIQIYCDFYSYSVIAKGSAKVLGIDLMDNFKEPLLAASIGEFWRRWHISLSTWFRDYLYIPLGGSRRGRPRHLFNLMAVFMVSGLWHGAAMHFVLWGVIHGLFNCLEAATGIGKGKKSAGLKRIGGRAYTFVVVVTAFVFFRADSISQGFRYIRLLFAGDYGRNLFLNQLTNSALGNANMVCALVAMAVLVVVDGIKYRGVKLGDAVARGPILLRWIILWSLILATVIFGVYGPGYAESQFIYFQF